MGLFHFKKKPEKKPAEEQPAQKPLSQEEVAQRWKDAYRANPQIYQKKDSDALLGSCALTEGVDTLLPLRPESQWAVDGKPISDWMLSLASTRKSASWGRWSIRRPWSALSHFPWRSPRI